MLKFFKKQILVFVIIVNSSISLVSNSYANLTPAFYGTSSLVPGLGQIFYGNFFEGISWFAISYGLISSKSATLSSIGQDLWFYNMYDAWKDAGGSPSTPDNIFYNYVQNFNPVNLWDPFSVGFIGLALSSRNEEEIGPTGKPPVLNSEALKSIAKYSFVGLGEEALFRGFLFPSLSSWMGVWGGAITSSIIFGFSHRGGVAADSVRSVMGMFLCWQYHRNNYRLAHNIFAHSWYDQVLVGPFMIDPLLNKKEERRFLSNGPIGLQATFYF